MAGKTLYDKLWDQHLVSQRDDGTALIYIDRQLIHEVTSPQAFEGLRIAGRKPWRVASNIAMPDHTQAVVSRTWAARRRVNCEGLSRVVVVCGTAHSRCDAVFSTRR